MQVYEDYADQADTWLSSKEAFLANDDLGVSVKSISFIMCFNQLNVVRTSETVSSLFLKHFMVFSVC